MATCGSVKKLTGSGNNSSLGESAGTAGGGNSGLEIFFYCMLVCLFFNVLCLIILPPLMAVFYCFIIYCYFYSVLLHFYVPIFYIFIYG